jgi:hypothetical protein
VKEPVLVHVGETFEELVHRCSNLLTCERALALRDELVQIALHEFKHEVELFILLDQFLQGDDSRVALQFLERFEFPLIKTILPALVISFDMLDCHYLTCQLVLCQKDLSKCPLAQHLCCAVFFHVSPERWRVNYKYRYVGRVPYHSRVNHSSGLVSYLKAPLLFVFTVYKAVVSRLLNKP